MCETRHDIRKSTQAYNQNKRKTRRGGSGPREGNDNDEWVVENRKSNKKTSTSQ
jgi:hypothetical protein